MKKMRLIALFMALCMLLSIPAMAAAGPVAENDKAKVTVVEGAGATVEFDSTYADRINLTVTSSLLIPGEQYVVLMVKSTDGVNYTIEEGNILYINQTDTVGAVASGDVGSVSFGVYPTALEDSVILIAGAKDGLIKAAVVNMLEEPFVLGDVNNDGAINVGDAMLLLQYAAGVVTADKLNLDAGNVNGDDMVNVGDAMKLLQFVAGVINVL